MSGRCPTSFRGGGAIPCKRVGTCGEKNTEIIDMEER